MVTMVLLKDACTCATPSATFFLTFLRTLVLALAIYGHSLLRSGRPLDFYCRLARSLARARIGARALSAHRQSGAMTLAAPGSEIHQPLDVHGYFAAQVALGGEPRHLFAQFLHVRVGQVLDLGCGADPGRR